MHPGHLLLICLQNYPDQDIKERLGLVTTKTSGNMTLWVSAATPADVSPALAECLAAGEVLSAALVSADISDDRLWVAYEWRGAFVAGRDLLPLLGGALDSWAEDSNYEHREFHILRPRHPARPEGPESGPTVEVETAREFASAIVADRPVLVHTTLEAVREDMDEWFGELADPHVGGALALLALSGATSRSTTVALRSPAALRLGTMASEVSLARHVREGRLAVRGYGYSRSGLRAVVESLPEMAPGAAGRILDEGLAGRASYGVLLRIEALVDPEVEIEEGSIFEQVSMNDVQTLSAAAPRRLTVRPGTFAPVPVPAWCLNRSLAPPAGEPVRPTPLVLTAPGRSQDEVWAVRQSVLAGETP